MRHKGYRYAVRWIADNDEYSETNTETLSGLLSVLLVADLYGKDPLEVSRAVLRVRLKSE